MLRFADGDVSTAPLDDIQVVSGGYALQGAAAGTVVAEFSAELPVAGGRDNGVTFALLNNPGGMFVFDGAQLKIADGSTLNYDGASHLNLRVQAIDEWGLRVEKEVSLTNTDGIYATVNLDDDGGPYFDPGLDDFTILGGQNDDQIYLSGAAPANVYASGGDDTLYASNEVSGVLFGDEGEDTLVLSSRSYDVEFKTLARGGTVVFDAGGGDLYLSGVEWLQFSDRTIQFSDIVFGPGDDQLSGSDGDDILFGSDGDNIIVAGSGNDVLIGGLGQDTAKYSGLRADYLITPNADGTITVASGTDEDVLKGVETLEFLDTDLSAAELFFGQSGSETVAQIDGSQWHLVEFGFAIENPVVVMGAVIGGDADPAMARIRNVTSEGFEFQIDEFDYLDGVHGPATLNWLAVEEGTHQLSDGRTIAAGHTQANLTASQVTFEETVTDALVFSQVVDPVDQSALVTRNLNVTDDGFKVRIQEQQNGDGLSVEDIGWIAIEADTGLGAASETLLFEAYELGSTIDHDPDSFVFRSDFEETPTVLASMQTHGGWDPAVLRITESDKDAFSIFAQEEQSQDEEVAHAPEAFAVIAFDKEYPFLF
ncbi:MAG: calcium-binding protein [Pseudomonadota bacterium]